MPRGGIAVAENTRFYPGEEANDPALAERFAALGDFYVNDAFGSAHRAHASTEGVARLLKPAVSGFLMEKELEYLGQALARPKRPFVAVMGGAKISGKIDLIEALLPRVDRILVGGAMACTFFKAMGLEVEFAGGGRPRRDGGALAPRPAGPPAARSWPKLDGAAGRTVPRDRSDGWAIRRNPPRAEFAAGSPAGTVIWNGPMGVFRRPLRSRHDGHRQAMARPPTPGPSRWSAGDSAAAVAPPESWIHDPRLHGGGASLEFLERCCQPFRTRRLRSQ
jgi:phosphoglycerate kinase